MASGNGGYFGVASEPTPNAAVAPTHFIPVMSGNFTVDQEEIEFKEIRGTRQNRRTFDGTINPDAELSTAFYPVGGIGILLRALIGNVQSAAETGVAGAFHHSFVNAASLPTLSLERSDSFQGEGGILTERARGAKVESMSLSASFGETVNLDFSLQATDEPTNPVPLARNAVTFPTIEPFTFIGASVQVDGVNNEFFKSIDLEVTNELERQNTLRKKRTARYINEGSLDVTLNASMEFTDLSMYNRLKQATKFPVRLHFESLSIITGSTKYQAIITLPTVKILSMDIPFEAEGVVEADVDFTVRNDTGSLINIELINADPVGAYSPA